MANKRLFLVHVPSRTAIYLGKRMAREWYDVPEDMTGRLREFLGFVGVNPETQDEIVVDISDGAGSEYRLINPEENGQ